MRVRSIGAFYEVTHIVLPLLPEVWLSNSHHYSHDVFMASNFLNEIFMILTSVAKVTYTGSVVSSSHGRRPLCYKVYGKKAAQQL